MGNIRLKEVYKSYGDEKAVVKNFTLDIKEHELIILVGPSGCGKSTVLRMIAGLEDITDGQLWIEDKLVNYVDAKDRGVSMVFQNYALYPNMNVYNNLAFPLQVMKMPRQSIDKRVREVAKILEIEDLLERRPKSLSGGQKQRVAIGSALIKNEKILLMDEPLSNLDAKLRMEMRVELARIHKEVKSTMLYVTHDQTEAMTLGDRVVVMKEGRVQQVATPMQLYNYPDNQFVAGFIGTPAMNFIKVDIVKKTDGIYARLFDQMIKLEAHLVKRLDEGEYIGDQVVLGVRAEDIHQVSQIDDECIQVKMHLKEVLGAKELHYFYIGNVEWCMQTGPDELRGETGKVSIRIDQEKVHFFDKVTGENILFNE